MQPKPNAPLRSRLNEVHAMLLAIHKAALDHERERYEQQHGKIPTAGQVLNLVINDPFFQWLRPLSALIVELDELTEADPLDTAAINALLAQARQLLTPNETGAPFQQNYFRTIQESPKIAALQAPWRNLLQSIQSSPTTNP